MSNFRIVFPDGTTAVYEGAIVRFTPDDSASPVEDFPIAYLMENLANVDDARDAMEETLKYPKESRDPLYIKALYDLEDAMAALFSDIILPPIVQPEQIGTGTEMTVSAQTMPEPEFWN